MTCGLMVYWLRLQFLCFVMIPACSSSWSARWMVLMPTGLLAVVPSGSLLPSRQSLMVVSAGDAVLVPLVLNVASMPRTLSAVPLMPSYPLRAHLSDIGYQVLMDHLRAVGFGVGVVVAVFFSAMVVGCAAAQACVLHLCHLFPPVDFLARSQWTGEEPPGP